MITHLYICVDLNYHQIDMLSSYTYFLLIIVNVKRSDDIYGLFYKIMSLKNDDDVRMDFFFLLLLKLKRSLSSNVNND
jgi:hypothetical protein